MLNIKQRQLNLYYYGHYYIGQLDGIEGPLLRKGYKDFQTTHGLVADGIYGKNTDEMLIAAVKDLQAMLNACGAHLVIDGIIGQATIEAIKTFQRANGLTVDGIAGVRTMGKLREKAWATLHYFKRSEFACGCEGRHCKGYPVEPSFRLALMLEALRTEEGKPIKITSGVRCKAYNKSLPGSSNASAHMLGLAADFNIYGVTTSATGRSRIKKRLYALGAKYTYSDTANMGIAVHVNI